MSGRCKMGDGGWFDGWNRFLEQGDKMGVAFFSKKTYHQC